MERRGLLREVEQCARSAEELITVAAPRTSDDAESLQSRLQLPIGTQPGAYSDGSSLWTTELPLRNSPPLVINSKPEDQTSDDSEDESIGDPEPDLEVGFTAEVYSTIISNLLQELQNNIDSREYDHAEKTYRIMVKHYIDRERNLGIRFDDRSELSEKLIEVHLKQQRYQKAKHILNQLLRETSLEIERKWRLYLSLANAYCGQNRLDKALLYAQRSLRGRERLYGQSNSLTQEAARLIIDIYERQGEVETANVLRGIYCPNTIPTPPPKSTLRSITQRKVSSSPDIHILEPAIQSPPLPSFQEDSNAHSSNHVRWAPDVWVNDSGINAILGSGKTSLIEAIFKGDEEYVGLLLSRGANVESPCVEMVSPLMRAVILGYPGIAKILLDHGAQADISTSGWTPLHKAVDLDDLLSMRLLLSHGANIEFKSPLAWIPPRSAQAKFRAIGSSEPDLEGDIASNSDQGWTPLHRASHKGNEAAVRLLLDRKADIEAQTPEKFTPLMCACENLHFTTVDLLLICEANVHAYDESGWRPIHRALVNRSPEPMNPILPLLLDREADVNARCNFGKTPLHYAVERNDCTAMSYLLSKGADIEARDLAECTPLHTAIESRLETAVRLLLEQGADAMALDGARHDAWTAANHTNRKSPEIIALLKRHRERLKRDNSAAAAGHSAKRPTFGERRRGSLGGGASSNDTHAAASSAKSVEKRGWFGSRSAKRK